MNRTVLKAVDALDTLLAAVNLRLSDEQGVLIPLMFHSLIDSWDELDAESIDPRYASTTAALRETVRTLTDAGYRFLAPADLGSDLDPGGCFAILTFDDGYANQLRALPVMTEYNVPAVFLVATGYIRSGHSFWWDVVYRESRRRGVSVEERDALITTLQATRPGVLEHELTSRFGPDSIRPEGHLDRPMNVGELQALAASPLATIGNHTRDHAITAHLNHDVAIEQIRAAQTDVESWTGATPTTFAFADGVPDARTVTWADDLGLKWGFTVDAVRMKLPLRAPDFQIGRFKVDSRSNVPAQIARLRSSWSLRRGYLNLRRLQLP